MRFQVNHFEEKDGQRTKVYSTVLRAKSAFWAIRQYLMPDAPVEGFASTNRYAEYRSDSTLVRAVVC